MEGRGTHLSVIIPVYNSERFLPRSLGALDEFISGLTCKAELIVVDDGSYDHSAAIAAEWGGGQRGYEFRVIRLGKNAGKGAAVASGMLSARGKFRIFLDADLTYQPLQILRILEALEDGADVAVASRVHPDSRYTISPAFFHYLYTRHLASRAINWAMRRIVIPHCHDSQAGLKGFSEEAAMEIFSRQAVRGFSFDIEALYLAERMGMTIREVPVDYKYFNEPTTVAFLKDGAGLLRDVARVRARGLLGRYRLPKNDGRRRLIVNADDFGMTLAISRGILAAAAAGAVCSASAMANSPDFEVSMDELMGAPIRPEMGFHATLTWGRPVSDPGDIPTLVGADGKFLSRDVLLLRAAVGLVSAEEAHRELRAQCERLARRWPQISHMDGHHHVHAFPVIREAAERVAREFGIRAVRSPREGLWSPWLRAVPKRLLVAILKASRPAYWRGRGFQSSDRFGGFGLGAGPNLAARWREALARIQAGTTEIMVHPGYRSSGGDSYDGGREEEAAFLCASEFMKAIGDEGLDLAAHRR